MGLQELAVSQRNREIQFTRIKHENLYVSFKDFFCLVFHKGMQNAEKLVGKEELLLKTKVPVHLTLIMAKCKIRCNLFG